MTTPFTPKVGDIWQWYNDPNHTYEILEVHKTGLKVRMINSNYVADWNNIMNISTNRVLLKSGEISTYEQLEQLLDAKYTT